MLLNGLHHVFYFFFSPAAPTHGDLFSTNLLWPLHSEPFRLLFNSMLLYIVVQLFHVLLPLHNHSRLQGSRSQGPCLLESSPHPSLLASDFTDFCRRLSPLPPCTSPSSPVAPAHDKLSFSAAACCCPSMPAANQLEVSCL